MTTLNSSDQQIVTQPRWKAVAAATGLVSSDGAIQPTIFAQMSALATQYAAVNLGQGFPDSDGPQLVKDLAQKAIRDGHNQYPPATGIASLRQAIADHQEYYYGQKLDPDTQILVTTGATEALTAAILALCTSGDEVITFEPFYDSYPAAIAMAGARHIPVPLVRTENGFDIDFDALEDATTSRTTMLVLNSPHNPTGMVASDRSLEQLADWAIKHDVLVLSDEVYEHLTFDSVRHRPIATLPGMFQRTLTVSSSGKSFSFTGWKIGWICGPHQLLTAVLTVKQYLTFASGAPFQPAIAAALSHPEFTRELADELSRRRNLLCAALTATGFDVIEPAGTYFVVADIKPFGYRDAMDFCRRLVTHAKVASVPVKALCRTSVATPFDSLIRFTFVKDERTLRQGITNLTEFAAGGARLS